ncbi:hypothetical protein HPB47_016554 [Ixodes persulcatus]|uniref:Uncharacterized protein n=1 Tax=Ixodes persulcatus TaxID=34615 RepID=A0AC60QU72_IXOPE|nr:hypothetical protein HPB47_016554 [Ixodes persulcatus]
MRSDYVVAHLDSLYANEIRDILENPPAANLYQHLKTELTRRLTLSEDQKVLTVHGSAALFDAGFAEAVLAYLPKPSSTTSPGLHVSASHDGATVIAADNLCPDKPFATDLLIAFNQRDPRDPTQGYIRAGDFGFVGFGAGTLSDMQLTLLLMLQESATGVSPDSKLRWSTLSGDAQRQSVFAEGSSADYHITFALQTSKNGRVPKANKQTKRQCFSPS